MSDKTKDLTPEQEIAALKKQLADEQKARKEVETEFNTLEQKLEETTLEKKSGRPVITHGKDKVKYRVNIAKFQIRKGPKDEHDYDGIFGVEDLRKDPKLVDLLLEKKSGVLSPYVEKKADSKEESK